MPAAKAASSSVPCRDLAPVLRLALLHLARCTTAPPCSTPIKEVEQVAQWRKVLCRKGLRNLAKKVEQKWSGGAVAPFQSFSLNGSPTTTAGRIFRVSSSRRLSFLSTPPLIHPAIIALILA